MKESSDSIKNKDLSFSVLKYDSVSPHVAEDESEPEEEGQSGEHAKQSRDSGCFESSEYLESGREEPKTEEGLRKEALEEQLQQVEEEHERKSEQQEENQREQLDVVQEQLQELTVDEAS